MTEDPTAGLAHAKLGASSSKRWTACTMSPAMEQGLPDEDSEFSKEGTCAHAVGETRLRNWLGIGPHDDESLVPDYETFFNKEFSDHVDTYVNYVIDRVEELRKQHGEANVTVLLEQRLDFSRWVPQGFGTGDVVICVPGKIIIIDLKFGAGIYVSGLDNSQMRLYALGAYNRYNLLYDFSEVEAVIVQPRKDNISGQTINVDDIDGILTWADELIVPRAAIAWAALQGDRSQARFSPGSHCSETFCKARFTCAARARYMLEIAEMPFSLDEPDSLTVPQLESVVDRADLAIKWAKDVQGYLLTQASAGKIELQRYKVVEGRSIRTISDQQAAAKLLMSNGFKAADIYKEPELQGLGALEKLVGKKNLTELLGDLLTKPPGKPTLTSAQDDRPPVSREKKQTAQDAFAGLDE
jgi:hypothetical protein